ncbi:MAG: IS66 family insertion sequence element accessory protein TnpB [Myxococcales bacterium]|nr:IS66 family insertion sequence element accessory protein TnpB [Myxococcales bacterium]
MIPSDVRIFLCLQPVDMKKSFDGLAAVAHQTLGEDPQSGALFIFVNKRKNRLKALWWNQNGYCLLYKRLHRALLVVPQREGEQLNVRIDGSALAALIAGQRQERRRVHRAA